MEHEGAALFPIERANRGNAIDDVEPNRNPNIPVLIVGPTGSGKTQELTAQAIAAILTTLNAENNEERVAKRALCMTSFNTSTFNLTAKIIKTLEAIIQPQEPILGPGQLPIVDPRYSTIHHLCRQWLATYGHLIQKPNMAEVCSEERAKELLEILQSIPEDLDLLSQIDREEELIRVRNKLVEELTLDVPNLQFLESAVRQAKQCQDIVGLSATSLQEQIRLFKIGDFHLSEKLCDYFQENGVDLLEEMQEWYDEILQYNRLYDFEDLVIFGMRLVLDHAQHIVKEEKIGLIAIDDLQNSYRQQRRFLNALMSVEDHPIKLIVACNDHHMAFTVGGQLITLDRTAYAFTGAHISLSPQDLMAELLPIGSEYERVEFRVNSRSTFAIQQIAYGIFNRHLVDVDREDGQHQPEVIMPANIPNEVQFFVDEVEKIHIQDTIAGRRLSSVTIMTRTNANVRFLVDALTKLYAPIRVMGVQNIDICSNEALDVLSFLGTIKDPTLHHLVQRSLIIFSKCKNDFEPHFEDLPAPELMLDYIKGNYIDGGEDDPRHIRMSEHHRQYLDILRRLRRSIDNHRGRVRGPVDSLLEELQYKEKILRTRLATRGSPSPPPPPSPPDFDYVQNAPHPSSDYAGARWQNLRSFLIRLEDFDDRCFGSRDPLDLLLRECHAYAPSQLAYIRRRQEMEITISTMHYGIGSEYDVVFLSGAEQDHIAWAHTSEEVRQEMALLHLTMLCARKRLYITQLQRNELTRYLDPVRQLLHFRDAPND